MNRKILFCCSGFAVLVLLFLGLVVGNTGFLHSFDIDEKDFSYWQRSGGVIVGAEEFEINGSREVCWMMIHGYSDSPNSMNRLALKVNEEFGDYVFAPRLLGHAEIPSHLLNYSLKEWYTQVLDDFERLGGECDRVNVLGFSFGGALGLKLAEEKNLGNVYLIAPYLRPTYKVYYGFSLEDYLDWFADFVVYTKKDRIANVNLPDDVEGYIGYWNFPLEPVKNSREFLEILMNDIGMVNESILIQHSCGDEVASCEMSQFIYDGVSSEVKDVVFYEDSNHVILEDYDKDEVIERVIDFEGENRD